jgi:hypothetical protein
VRYQHSSIVVSDRLVCGLEERVRKLEARRVDSEPGQSHQYPIDKEASGAIILIHVDSTIGGHETGNGGMMDEAGLRSNGQPLLGLTGKQTHSNVDQSPTAELPHPGVNSQGPPTTYKGCLRRTSETYLSQQWQIHIWARSQSSHLPS